MRSGRVFLNCIVAAWLMMACTASAAPVIFVDTSGIDARTDLTDTQKQEVKNAMKDTIKENLDEAFGECNTTVTDDPKDKGTAGRTVTTSNTVGQRTDKDGNTNYYWGQWEYGSSNTTVFVGTYMNDPPGVSGSFKKPDGSWDTAKLGKAMGTTGAHEVAHSYSAGHDDNNTNKLNTANSGDQLAGGLDFNDPAKKTLQENKGKPPCTTVTNYSTLACIADWWSDPAYQGGYLLHEPWSITTSFEFGGPLAWMFDFGWWGIDTDNGAIDGNAWGDFVYKSSMKGASHDNSRITFFDACTAHFVLRGRRFTPYEGQYFDVGLMGIWLSNWVTRPDLSRVARHIDLFWDVDGMIGPDVTVSMDTNCYGPMSPPFSGFRLGIAPSISIPEAKLRVDGTMVCIKEKMVTAILPGVLYVQEPNRASGIRVMWTGPVFMDKTAEVVGKITTNADGERQIEAMKVMPMSDTPPARPLAMTNKSVGGGDFHFTAGLWPSGQRGVMNGVGLNNIGLHVKVFGRVVEVEQTPVPTWFVIDDGSGVMLKIFYGPSEIYPEPEMYVSVIGISSCEASPVPKAKPLRVVRAVHWDPVVVPDL